jgi:hypothetical protein
MAIDKNTVPNIDDSDPADYPNGQIRDNDGSDNGTPVARVTFSDMFETFAKLMRMAQIAYNGTFDNEASGYQYIQALQALAGKNDIVQTMTAGSEIIGGVNTPVLILSSKIEILQSGEFFIVKPNFDYAAQLQLRGATAAIYKTISTSSAFKANDTLIITNGVGGVQINTLITADILNLNTANLGFLKAASQPDENAGTSNTVATTPITNKTVFALRVNGGDSGGYLATTSRNGLLSAADKLTIDTFADPVKNRGWFSGVDVGGMTVGANLAHSGDVASAIVAFNQTGSSTVGAETDITVTIANAMTGVDYFVRAFVESQGNIHNDNNLALVIFRPINATSFTISMSETEFNTIQSVKVHVEVVQIS